MTAENNHPVRLEAGEGRSITTMGVVLTLKAVSEDTGGKYACYEYIAPPGFDGPPAHTHPGFDEAWYVLDGVITVLTGSKTATAGPGTFLHLPGTTVHGFSNRGRFPARFLGLIVPGGFERFYEELPAIVAQHGYPPPASALHEAARKYGVIPAPPRPPTE